MTAVTPIFRAVAVEYIGKNRRTRGWFLSTVEYIKSEEGLKPGNTIEVGQFTNDPKAADEWENIGQVDAPKPAVA